MDDTDKILLTELQQIIGRDRRTIDSWVREARRISDITGQDPPDGYLPRALWPENEDWGHKRVFWPRDDVVIDGLKAFAAEKDRRKGFQKLPAT